MLPYGIDPDIADLSKRLSGSSHAAQGIMAVVILLLLLCLIVLYCCWGACSGMFRAENNVTLVEDCTGFSSVISLPYGGIVFIENSEGRPGRTERTNQQQALKAAHQSPPSYDTLFGPANCVPPSYSSLDLQNNVPTEAQSSGNEPGPS